MFLIHPNDTDGKRSKKISGKGTIMGQHRSTNGSFIPNDREKKADE